MRKTLCVIVILLFLVGCGDPKTLKGQVYETYGFFNKHNKSSDVCYEVSMGNVIWSIVLIETIIAPLYFLGWSLFEPATWKSETNNPDGCW